MRKNRLDGLGMFDGGHYQYSKTRPSRIRLGGCRDEFEIRFKGPAQNRSTRPRLESTRLNPSSRRLTRSDSTDSAESMPSLY